MPGLAEEAHGESTKWRKAYGKRNPNLKTLPDGVAAASHGFVDPEDDRDWSVLCTSPKVDSGKPDVPTVRSGFREERLGSDISHRLKASGEYLNVNVGGSCGEGCSPPAKRMSVGGVIVLGGRESRLHGEGRQGIDVRRTNNRRSLGEVQVSLVK